MLVIPNEVDLLKVTPCSPSQSREKSELLIQASSKQNTNPDLLD